MEVSHLPDAVAFHLWPAIERILSRARHSEEVEIFDPAIDVAWIAYDGPILWGACTTRLRTDGIAEVRLIGGKRFREWIGPLDEEVTKWARACGAPRLETRGRVGWKRFSSRFGWAELATDDDQIIFEKRL